jgi:hypothetical protein
VAAGGGEVAADFTRQNFRVFTYLPKLGEGESAVVDSGKLRTGDKGPVAVKKMKRPSPQAQAATINKFAAVGPKSLSMRVWFACSIVEGICSSLTL